MYNKFVNKYNSLLFCIDDIITIEIMSTSQHLQLRAVLNCNFKKVGPRLSDRTGVSTNYLQYNCQNPNSTNSSIQQSLRLNYILTCGPPHPTTHPHKLFMFLLLLLTAQLARQADCTTVQS